jgi:hypothetical protein
MAVTAPASHRAARPRVDWTAVATAVLVYLVAFLWRLATLACAAGHVLRTAACWLLCTFLGLAVSLVLVLVAGAVLVWLLGAPPSDPLVPGPARMTGTGYGDYGPPDAGTGGRIQVDTSRIHEPSTGRLP